MSLRCDITKSCREDHLRTTILKGRGFGRDGELLFAEGKN